LRPASLSARQVAKERKDKATMAAEARHPASDSTQQVAKEHKDKAKVFISYRREDSRYQARMIHSAFCKAIPKDHVFMDIDSIPPGANFRKILKNWVGQCEILLALIGPGWLEARNSQNQQRRLDNKSDFVRIEIGEALARGIPVVPVLLDGAPIPDVDLLPDDLKELVDRQAEFVEYRTFDADVERLIRKLRLTAED
jgi:hypothetical protein